MKPNKLISVTCQGNAWLRPDELVEFQGDLKTLTEENYKKLRASIADPQIGFSFPVFVWRNRGKNYIIDGHQRLITVRRMIEEGWSLKGGKLPVDWIEAPDIKTAKKKVVLAVSQYGAYNDESFMEFLKTADLDFNGLKDMVDLPQIDLDQFAIDWEKNLGGGEEDNGRDDEVPPIPKKPKTRSGELWLMDKHRLLCGDSTKQKEVEKLMDGNMADMVFTDPPYGANITKIMQTTHASIRRTKRWEQIKGDEYKDAELQSFLESAFRNISLFSKDNAAWYIWHAMLTQGFFAAAAAAAALILHRQIIWVKPTLILAFGHYHWKHELCFYGWKKGHKPRFWGPTNSTTVWELDFDGKGRMPAIDRKHPTQKPVSLAEKAILNSTRKSESVIDGFLGSGSTLIACEKTGRICYGMEIEPHYCDVILQRWADYTGKDPVREDGMKWSNLCRR